MDSAERGGESVVNDGNEFVFFGEGHGFVNIDERSVGFVGVRRKELSSAA